MEYDWLRINLMSRIEIIDRDVTIKEKKLVEVYPITDIYRLR
jgi:hypothetical protein